MNNFIYKLIYISSAATPLSESELTKILQKSRENNAPRNITGLLLYSDGNIIQLLEGEKNEVEELYKIIERDDRHGGVIRLLAEYDETRDFPDWSMGFKRLARDGAEIEGFSDLVENRKLENNEMETLSKKAKLLVQTFRKTSGIAG